MLSTFISYFVLFFTTQRLIFSLVFHFSELHSSSFCNFLFLHMMMMKEWKYMCIMMMMIIIIVVAVFWRSCRVCIWRKDLSTSYFIWLGKRDRWDRFFVVANTFFFSNRHVTHVNVCHTMGKKTLFNLYLCSCVYSFFLSSFRLIFLKPLKLFYYSIHSR